MNIVRSICDNFESMTDNKKITLLFDDSGFDENKNKFIFILQSSIIYKKLKDSADPCSNKVHLLINAVIIVFSELTWFMLPQFLLFIFQFLIFIFFVSIFRFPRQLTLLSGHW